MRPCLRQPLLFFLPLVIITSVGMTGRAESPKAKRLLQGYRERVGQEMADMNKDLIASEKYAVQNIKKVLGTLISELKKNGDPRDKGLIDALRDEKPSPLTPTEIRQRLPGSPWTGAKGTNQWTFQADGTIKTSWHNEATLWSVRADGTIRVILNKNRSLTTIRVNDAQMRSCQIIDGPQTGSRVIRVGR